MYTSPGISRELLRSNVDGSVQHVLSTSNALRRSPQISMKLLRSYALHASKLIYRSPAIFDIYSIWRRRKSKNKTYETILVGDRELTGSRGYPLDRSITSAT